MSAASDQYLNAIDTMGIVALSLHVTERDPKAALTSMLQIATMLGVPVYTTLPNGRPITVIPGEDIAVLMDAYSALWGFFDSDMINRDAIAAGDPNALALAALVEAQNQNDIAREAAAVQAAK